MYKLDSEAAHVYVYGMGTVTRRGLSAIITKSPYMRRLQAIRYFSDLYGILETTYEQHVQGTAEIASRYTQEYLKLLYNFVENALLRNRSLLERVTPNGMGEDRQEPSPDIIDVSLKYLGGVYREYAKRVGKASEVSTLIGMLATPPFRRPFGTVLKRRAMKILVKMYLEESKESIVRNLLRNMKKSIVGFYEELLKAVDEGYAGLIPPLRALFHVAERLGGCSPKEDAKEKECLKEKEIRESISENIKKFYESRLTTFDELGSHKIISILYPALFTLRFRNLGTALGAGYAIKAIAESLSALVERDDRTFGSGNDAKRLFCGMLYKILDILFQLGDAILINHNATLLVVSDIAKLECGPEGRTFYANVALGAPYIVLTDYGLLEAGSEDGIRRVSNDFKGLSMGFQRVKTKELFKGRCRLVDLEGLFDSMDVKELLLTYPFFESAVYRDIREVPCCIFGPLDMEAQYAYERSLGTRVDSRVLSLTALIFRLSLPIKPRDGVRPLVLQHGLSPFVSHFKVNQIQADDTPSAYQLDLLNKLDKDINLGLRIDLSRLNDIIFNVDNYSFTVFSTLNTIYTFLLKDVATVMLRMRLLSRLSSSDGGSPCILKTALGEAEISMLDLISIFYYYLISKEFEKIVRELGDRLKEIREMEKMVSDSSDSITRERCGKLLSIIANIIEKYAAYLEGYVELVSLIALELARRCVKEEYRGKLPEKLDALARSIKCRHGIDLRSLTFSDFSDYFVRNLLGAQSSLAEDPPEKRRLVLHGLISILDVFNYTRDSLQGVSRVSDKYKYNLYNILAFYISVGLQQVLSTSLSAYLADYINKRLENTLGSAASRLRVSMVSIQAPSQGVLKPFFHLPLRQPAIPRLIEGIDLGYMASQQCQQDRRASAGGTPENGADGIVDFIECIAEKLKYADSIVHEADVSRLLGMGEDGRLALGAGGEVIIPDQDYWEILAVGASKSDLFREFSMGNPKTRSRLFYGNLHFIYTIIVDVDNEAGSRDADRGVALDVSLGNLKHSIEEALIDAIYKLFVESTLSPPLPQADNAGGSLKLGRQP